MNEDIVQIHLIIHGRVQGVYFRNFTLKNAEDLGVCGWVKNRKDKSVEALLQGTPDVVAVMKERLQDGPVAARVDRIEELESRETQIYHTFKIVD